MLTLLTATGCRPFAWELCQRMMARQTYDGSVRWVIVDDGAEAQNITFQREGWYLEVVRPEPFWRPGMNTQARNLIAGLKRIKSAERLVVIEDDDWYAPAYLEAMNKALDRSDLVGESRARYYNVQTRYWRQMSNIFHASLCATAMKGYAIDVFKHEVEQQHKFIDIHLWKKFRGRSALHGAPRLTVGIKGLPGRTGIGTGHAPDFRGMRDNDGMKLREWIGADAEWYA